MRLMRIFVPLGSFSSSPLSPELEAATKAPHVCVCVSRWTLDTHQWDHLCNCPLFQCSSEPCGEPHVYSCTIPLY